MTFTYSDALTTDRDKIRLRTGDTQANAGPRPDKRNFSDEEITFILSEEDSRVNGAIAHTFEILASEWSSYQISEREGQAWFDAKKAAEWYLELSIEWRSKPDGSDDIERSGSLITLEREDAYTD